MLKAKIVKPADNGKNYAYAKETVSTYNVVGRMGGDLRTVLTCRAYMGRSRTASTVYASLWVHGPKHTAGHGSAGGYGYHKESAAIQEAITRAGIELYGSPYCSPYFNRWNYAENRAFSDQELKAQEKTALKPRAYIHGVGDSAIEAALLAIAKAAGATGRLVFVKN